MARILISAGEVSGDRYGAAVVREIAARRPGTEFRGLGGARLESTGVSLVGDNRDSAVMGIMEVLASVPRHARILRTLKSELSAGSYDLAILIDYPDFNLRLARTASRAGVPVLYYVAPQLWAWRQHRIKEMRSHVDRLAVILPFEESYFSDREVDATWVGHPLMDAPSPPSRSEARKRIGLDDAARLVALLPGSRPQELARHAPCFRDAARAIADVVPCTSFLVGGEAHPETAGVMPYDLMDPATVLAAADVAITKSGTISLETALAGVPHAIAYRMNGLSYSLARRMVEVPHIGLANLILEESAVPEFVQGRATGENLSAAVIPLLETGSAAATAQREAFERLRKTLGGPGASKRVADMALELLGR